MNWFLKRMCAKVVTTGLLRVTDPGGVAHDFGDGSGDRVHVAVRTTRAERALAVNPGLALPEAYMRGELEFLEGDMAGLLELVYANMEDAEQQGLASRFLGAMDFVLRRLHQWNTRLRSQRNVRHHYDLSGEMYRLFLDADLQYSCAYFETPQASLEEAQLAKKRHIAAKLRLQPGMRVLDIGCGWGGTALYLGRRQAEVLGVTLSQEQLQVASQRARRQHLDERVRFELRDYRALQGPFDRIVSVGMFEHVGVGHYRAFFEKCADLLKPDGVMLLHTIGRSGPPAQTAPFIRKYIFPGGYIPALSEVLPAVERSGLMVTDIEVLRLHYAETLRAWRERFMAARRRAAEIYDERFARMWEFYLAASETAFRRQGMVVFQIQLARRADSLPVTRDYMIREEKRLGRAEPRDPGGYCEAAE